MKISETENQSIQMNPAAHHCKAQKCIIKGCTKLISVLEDS